MAKRNEGMHVDEIEFHPFAEVFPLIEGIEFAGLVADIKQHGQRQPVTLFSGKVLDGRNRFRACKSLGIAPRTVEFLGTDLEAIDLVVSENIHRRHLTASQAAAVAVEFEEIKGGIVDTIKADAKERQRAGRPKGSKNKEPVQRIEPVKKNNSQLTDAKLATLHGTNRQYIADIRKVKSVSASLAADIKLGKKTIPQAKREIRKQEQAERESQLAKLSKFSASAERSAIITSDQSLVECDALITDPPYGILDEEWEPDQIEEFTRDWSGRWACSGANYIAVFFAQRYMFELRQWLDESLDGYEFQQVLIWHYRNITSKPKSRKGFKQSYEPILLYRLAGTDREIRVAGSDWGADSHDMDCHTAAVPQSNFNDADTKVHPAQKPVSVMSWLVGCMTQPGDLVVDPFAGSGTTGIACAKLGRSFHGIELDEDHRKSAERRIAAYGV